jgi:1-phosphofructokinase family hexose kinase
MIPGAVHRAEQTIVAAGGKGLNVVRAIHTLGGESVSMGFLGGHTGRLLADMAQKAGLNSAWTWTNSETRTCTILVTQDGDATVINEPGMAVPATAWKRLMRDVQKNISSADVVCICGSFSPRSSVENFHGLLRLLVDSGKQVWVDTSGSVLDTILAFPEICIKVNAAEIGVALGLGVKKLTSAKHALRMIRGRGLTACAITLGANGALLATDQGNWYAQGPRVQVISTVGSGDSFLGGLVNARASGKDWSEALMDAVAAGTANALSAGGGRFTFKEFKEIRRQVRIQTW